MSAGNLINMVALVRMMIPVITRTPRPADGDPHQTRPATPPGAKPRLTGFSGSL